VLLPWSNTFSDGAGSDQFQLLLVAASRFTSAIERSGKMEEGKIAAAWAQFGATERDPINVYKNAYYLGVTLLLWTVRINFSSLVNNDRFTSAIA
jgi:hypothetical protein